MNKAGERLFNGIVKENPTLVLMLGMCPTLAVTTSAVNGLGMGLTTMAVLALSNLIISLLRRVIPARVRIPAFIVIIASFVTVVQLLLQAYLPFLYDALGVYIPLIVVNCIILGRAESYAYTNPPVPALFDGIGMGLGFTLSLTCIGALRELLGAGELFGFSVMPEAYEPVRIFSQAPGAFFVLAALVALQNFVKEKRKKQGKPYEKIGSGCSEDCMNCQNKGCTRRFYDETAEPARQKETPKPEKAAEQEAAVEPKRKEAAAAEQETAAEQEAAEPEQKEAAAPETAAEQEAAEAARKEFGEQETAADQEAAVEPEQKEAAAPEKSPKPGKQERQGKSGSQGRREKQRNGKKSGRQGTKENRENKENKENRENKEEEES